jgi:AmiR/NasT family two-component response regulator
MNTYIQCVLNAHQAHQLMQQAEQTNSRREAIKLINQATEYLTQQHHCALDTATIPKPPVQRSYWS